jgi:hypothetical protein
MNEHIPSGRHAPIVRLAYSIAIYPRLRAGQTPTFG